MGLEKIDVTVKCPYCKRLARVEFAGTFAIVAKCQSNYAAGNCGREFVVRFAMTGKAIGIRERKSITDTE